MGYVDIFPATDDAPFALFATLGATGGSWAASTAHSFLLIAWDDPDEQDPEQARYINNAWGVTPSTGGYSICAVTTGAGNNDIITLSWTPPRRPPHHYQVYYQVAASYAFENVGTRLRQNWTIATADTAADTFTVVGDHTAHFTTGSTFVVAGSTGNNGEYTVLSSSFGGGVTTITVAAVADTTDDGYIYGGAQGYQWIPGWATSAVFQGARSYLETRSAKVKTVNTNTSYDVYGNHALYLYQGASVSGVQDASAGTAAHTLDGGHPDLSINTGGRDTLTRAYEGATQASTDWLQYERGLLKWETAAALNMNGSVRMSIVTDMQAQLRDPTGLDYQGRRVGLAYVTDDDVTGLTLQCTHGGLALDITGSWTDASAAAALATLDRWRRGRLPLLINPTTSGALAGLTLLRGYIVEINEWGHTSIQSNQRIEVRVEIDRIFNHFQSGPLLRYTIAAVSTASDWIAIDGDHRYHFVENSKIYVRGSTGNDGFYSIDHTTLSSGSTILWTKNEVASSTADGVVELIDSP